MSIAVESAAYLDLIPNMDDSLESFNNTINERKNMIFQVHQTTIAQEKQAKRDELIKNQVSEDDALALLNGEAFTQLGNLKNPKTPNVNFNIFQNNQFGVDSNSIANFFEKAGDIEDFCNTMQKQVIDYLTATSPGTASNEIKEVYSSIAMNVFTNFAQGRGGANRAAKIYKTDKFGLAKAVISTILKKENSTFYTKIASMQQSTVTINSFVVRIVGLIESLRMVGDINNISNISIPKEKKDNNKQVQDVIIETVQTWFEGLNNLSAEATILDADYIIKQQVGSTLNTVQHSIELVGTTQVKTEFKISKDMEELLSIGSGKKKPQFNSFNRQVSKSDTSFYLRKNADGGYVGQIGFSVKNGYKNFDNLLDIDDYSFNAVKQTPLMTLMIKDAGLTFADMTSVYKILSGHPPTYFKNALDKTGYTTQTLESYWENIKNYILCSGILNSLSNLGHENNTQDKVFYMVLGGALFKIEDIIATIEEQLKNRPNNTLQLLYERTSKIDGKGLSRDSYVEKNKMLYEKGTDYKNLAMKRSRELRININQILYRTKVKVGVNLNKKLLQSVRI